MSRLMSKHERTDSDGDDKPSAEKESLSSRMLELIEIATVEERRKSSDGRAPGPGDRRRETGKPGKTVKRAT